MGFTLLLAGFLLRIILVGSEGLDDTLHDEVVELFLVAAEVGGMQSGRDYAMTVIWRFAIVEGVAGAEPANLLSQPAISGIVFQHTEVTAHGVIHVAGDSVLVEIGV